MIRIVIVDDQDLIRRGLRGLIEEEDDLEVVGEAADGLDAVARTRAERPDVVLMDIRMPGVDGLEASRRILSDAALEATKVIVLTTFEQDEYVMDALRFGASGFLLKDSDPDEILDAVRLVHAGQALLAPAVTRGVIKKLVQAQARVLRPHPQLNELTAREAEVVALVGRGRSNDEIAAELVVSPATARTHVSRAMLKLGARDRAQLVVFAYQSGLVD